MFYSCISNNFVLKQDNGQLTCCHIITFDGHGESNVLLWSVTVNKGAAVVICAGGVGDDQADIIPCNTGTTASHPMLR